MMNNKLILSKGKNIVYPIEIINDEYVVYAENNTDENNMVNRGVIYLQDMKSGQKVALAEGGDYSAPISLCYNDKIYIAYTSYYQGKKCVYLQKYVGLKKEQEACVVTYDKIDNITLAVHKNRLYLSWESFDEGYNKVLVKSIGIEESINCFEQSNVICVTKKWENSYKPSIISDGRYLYVAYESFFHNRYHILVRVIENNVISDAIDIGFDNNNNQNHSMCIRQGRVLVVFENSWPLYKGYKWLDKVVMPAFGHGWKVETTMGLVSIKYDAGCWDIKHIKNYECETSKILPHEYKSSGCPYVFIDKKGVIYVSFLEWVNNEYGRRWEIRTKYFNGVRWVKFEKNKVGQLQRLTQKTYANHDEHSYYLAGIDFQEKISKLPEWTQDNEMMTTTINKLSLPVIIDIKGYEWVDERPKIIKEVEFIKGDRFEVSGIEGIKKLFWGDLHMHSNLSGCSLRDEFHCTELEEKYRFCKDVAKLDFALNTDLDSMHIHEWVRTINAAEIANVPGEFVAFQGFEWTCTHFNDKINCGHYNVLYKGTGPLLKTSESNADHIDKVWDILKNKDVLTIPHHPSDSSHYLNWNYFNKDMEPLVEIFQVRGSYEYDNCPMNPNNYGRSCIANGSIRYGLNLGYKFGFTSGGEHEGVGVTGVYADSLTRESIYEALKNRNTFGTTGDRISVEFRVNGHLMGSDLGHVTGDMNLTIKIIGTDMLDYIYIVKDGKEIERFNGISKDMEINWREQSENIEIGHHYYYVGLRQINDEMAWASPVFFETTR